MNIEPFDAATASDADLRAYYEFDCAIERETEPGDPVPPFDVAAVEFREPPSWEVVKRWLARDGGEIVGRSLLELEYVDTNRHLGWFDVAVRPDRRGDHVATRLLAPVVDAAAADGRTVLGVDAVEDTAGAAFVAALGLEKRAVERRSRLLTAEVDRTMLEEWVALARQRASDYSLIGFDDACPEELLDAYVGVTEIMNTAPREELDMEDWHDTPARVREREARRARRRRHQWTLMVRHDPTGALAGFTDIGWGDWMDDLAWQGGTAVDPAHREKGIGRWLKAAMLLRVLDERPEVARIDTWNAGSNRPMLAINVALGFRPVKHYGTWQIATDGLLAAVTKRV
ncbi:MAG: GNAT family N-acetyltransferase [Actinobacteria bacterium]|nr:GNAT family N-acetyltransferase [Actinomycetota bacterium]